MTDCYQHGMSDDGQVVENRVVISATCANCLHYDRPPRDQWPDSAFGACMNKNNVCIGPQGWGSGPERPMVTDTMSCSNFEALE